jgi:hypothetical protein
MVKAIKENEVFDHFLSIFYHMAKTWLLILYEPNALQATCFGLYEPKLDSYLSSTHFGPYEPKHGWLPVLAYMSQNR